MARSAAGLQGTGIGRIGRLVPGPLRIVVAIAAPLDSGGGVVDYERHLRSVIAENNASGQQLRQYLVDLAANKEQEFKVMDQEAQRCRAILMDSPPRKTVKKK